jgi:hypothetical protein
LAPTELDVGAISQLEIETLGNVQDHLLAFIKDPATVSSAAGWPMFNPNGTDGGLMIEFGNGAAVKNYTGEYVEGACWYSSTVFPYND